MIDGKRGQPLATVTGKPASASLVGTVVPAMFGITTLQLFQTRVVETTKRIMTERDSEILLTQIDSAELTANGRRLWLLLGLLTLSFYGLGLVFIILYFVAPKHRCLIIRSASNAQFVAFSGDEMQYSQFMEAVLAAAEQQKGRA